MQTQSEHDFSDLFTWRPAPFIPNRHSVQAVGADPTSPLLTLYRTHAVTAERWISKAARQRPFKYYFLQRVMHHWELYNDVGEYMASCTTTPPASEKEKSTTVVPVDRAAFLQEAREHIGDDGLTLLACAEGQAGASAADHSNFAVVCRRMIAEADPRDLEHVYLIDSRSWPCRVTGVFANVSKLSPQMQDLFLERVKWINNSWPLVKREFRDILADRLSTVRTSYVYALLKDCGRAAGMSEDGIIAMTTKWALASPGFKYRFAQHIVSTLTSGLVHGKNAAETFDPDVVRRYGSAVVKDYKKHLIPSRP